MNFINRVCIVDSSYTLLLYLLLSNEEEIDHTFYFWSRGIPEQVKEYFQKQSYSFDNIFNNKIQQYLFQIKLYQYQAIHKWPFLKKKNITYWGQDHTFFSSGILRKNFINLIEDGSLNYYPNTAEAKRFKIFRKFLCGPLHCLPNILGLEKECKNIYLTGLVNTTIMNNPKVKKISLYDLWNNSSNYKKNKILDIFNLTQSDIILLKSKSEILITQTFSEDNIITETEKIQLYKEIIKSADANQLIIKPHPRETTNYHNYFSNLPVFNKKVPFQLLSLCGIQFKKVYTISSTVAFNFPYKIDIVYIGSQVHPKIYKAQPDLSLNDISNKL